MGLSPAHLCAWDSVSVAPAPQRLRGSEVDLVRAQGLGAAPGVVHGFTTRKGGGSQGAFAALNLGTSVGDDRSAVADNRQRVLRGLGKSHANWVSLKQVHGAAVVEVTRLASKSI